jgi:multiple sugar transport system substrate-binding protein/sn-glycerol 3-phosphate transport system substrate-binding protein
MKKIQSAAFLALVVINAAFLALSCQKKQEQQAAAEVKQTVQFWHSMSGANGQLLENIIAKFNETHPNTEVAGTFQGGYWEASAKAYAAISAGEAPDILQMGADMVISVIGEEGVLADLNPYFKKANIDPNDFIEAFVWDYKVNGGFFAVPFGRSTPVVYINRDMLDAQGLKPPTTWAEWKQVANALVQKDANGQIARYGMTMPYDTWYFYMIVAQAGGKFINDAKTAMGCIDDGTALEAFTFYQDMAKTGALYFDVSGGPSRQLFLDGKAGMHINSVANMTFIHNNAKFKYEVIWVPQGKVRVVPSGGNAVGMLNSSKVKDAAWSFLEWSLKDPNGIEAFSLGTGYFPVTYSMSKSAAVQAAWQENPFRKVAFEQLQYASDKGHRVVQTVPIMNELFVLEEAIMYDFADVKTQLDILNKSIIEILKQ